MKEISKSVFADNMITFVKNPMKSTKKILELSEFSQVTEFNINIKKKKTVFLFISNKQLETENILNSI